MFLKFEHNHLFSDGSEAELTVVYDDVFESIVSARKVNGTAVYHEVALKDIEEQVRLNLELSNYDYQTLWDIDWEVKDERIDKAGTYQLWAKTEEEAIMTTVSKLLTLFDRGSGSLKGWDVLISITGVMPAASIS